MTRGDMMAWKIYHEKLIDDKIYQGDQKTIEYVDSVSVSKQDSMIFYIKEIHNILDNGRISKSE